MLSGNRWSPSDNADLPSGPVAATRRDCAGPAHMGGDITGGTCSTLRSGGDHDHVLESEPSVEGSVDTGHTMHLCSTFG